MDTHGFRTGDMPAAGKHRVSWHCSVVASTSATPPESSDMTRCQSWQWVTHRSRVAYHRRVVRGASTTLLRRLGKRIHDLRVEQKHTQEALAQRCGLSQKYLSELERGSKAPSWGTLVKLCNGLGIKLAVLVFTIDDDREDEPKRIEDLLAGRSRDARYDLLHGMQLILRAAEAKR